MVIAKESALEHVGATETDNPPSESKLEAAKSHLHMDLAQKITYMRRPLLRYVSRSPASCHAGT